MTTVGKKKKIKNQPCLLYFCAQMILRWAFGELRGQTEIIDKIAQKQTLIITEPHQRHYLRSFEFLVYSFQN